MSLFFVLGNPRSGTSLFRLMLNSHPEIVVPPECGFTLWLADKYKEINPEKCDEFASDVIRCKKFETWGVLKEDILSQIRHVKPVTYEQLVSCVYSAYANKNKKEQVLKGDKNNYYINHVDVIKDLFPDAKLVFIVRDGRDVACSYLDLKNKEIDSRYKPNLPDNIEMIAEEWKKNAETLIRNQSNSIFVRYEDLIEEPVKELSKVCEHIGLKFSENMLMYMSSNDEPVEFLQWKSKTKEKVDNRNKNKFKEILSHAEIKSFEKIAFRQLESLGYIL